MQLRQIDERLERLEDAAIDRIIDADGFTKRKEQLLLRRATIAEVMAQAAKRRADPATVRRFLERIKNIAEHYAFAGRPEQREIARIATSNRTVAEKYVSIKPANWLETVRQSVNVFSCAQERT
jgi:hypothetical protein